MRVRVVDPAAYTPPYDHALCAALARAGAQVTLATTAFDLMDSLSGRPELRAPARRFETPSIEPTLDGYVGFCTNAKCDAPSCSDG